MSGENFHTELSRITITTISYALKLLQTDVDINHSRLLYFLALLLNPQSSKARFRLAQSLQGEGRIAEAFAEITSLLEKYPEVKLFGNVHSF